MQHLVTRSGFMFAKGLLGMGATILAAQAGAATLTLNCPGALTSTPDQSGNLVISCASSTTTGQAPVCSPYASPSTVAPSGTTTLYANCDSNASSFVWSVNAAMVSTLNAWTTSSLTANTTYTLVATGPTGLTSTPKNVTVTVSSVSTPPPTSSGTCGNLPTVDIGTLAMDGNRHYSNAFGANEIAIATLQVPAGVSSNLSSIAIAEYASLATYRKVWASKTRCDLSGQPPYYTYGNNPILHFSVGATYDGAMTFQPGETWYIHIKNEKPNGVPSCPSNSNCDVSITAYPPN